MKRDIEKKLVRLLLAKGSAADGACEEEILQKIEISHGTFWALRRRLGGALTEIRIDRRKFYNLSKEKRKEACREMEMDELVTKAQNISGTYDDEMDFLAACEAGFEDAVDLESGVDGDENLFRVTLLNENGNPSFLFRRRGRLFGYAGH